MDMGSQYGVLPGMTPERRRESAPRRLLAWLRLGQSDAVSATRQDLERRKEPDLSWPLAWLRPGQPSRERATRQDIERQKGNDSSWGDLQGTLHARMAAVLVAQAAVARHEPAAPYALRQACIDLASAAELVAEELPPPTVR